MLNTISITQFPTHIQQRSGWVSKARELYKIKQSIKALSDQEKLLIDNLKELSSHENSKGGGFVFTRNERIGSIQYKDIPLLYGLDLDQYRGTVVEFWKLEKK